MSFISIMVNFSDICVIAGERETNREEREKGLKGIGWGTRRKEYVGKKGRETLKKEDVVNRHNDPE